MATGIDIMNVLKDQAFCIGHMNYSESSQIVTLFGRETGKIQAIAKGARRSKAKFSGGIDLLTKGEIIFYPPRDQSSLGTLAEYNLLESFPQLRNGLLAINCGLFAADRLAEFTQDFDPHPGLYDTFCETLNQLEKSDRPDIVLLKFEIILLHAIGLASNWQKCSSCRRQIQTNQKAYFSSQNGGVLCRDCEPAIMEKIAIEPTTIRLLADTTRLDAASTTEIFTCHKLLCYHQREILGKQPHIMTFLNQLLSQNVKNQISKPHT